MKVCIFGSGGVGGYFGARLAKAGMDVTFVARGAHHTAMSENGLKLTSICGDLFLDGVNSVEAPADNAPYDIVILAVKAWQVEDAAVTLKDTLSVNGVVIPLQNGVEAPDILANVLGEAQVLTGLCGIVSFLKEPGHVHHIGIEPFIQIGERNGLQSNRVESVAAALNVAQGMKVTVPDDIRLALWKKFLFIVAMSGIGSITRAPIGITRENVETRKLMVDCVNEVYEVGLAHGIALPSDAVDRTMAMIDAAPPEATASMQRDIMQGKPSELYNQNDAVTRFGDAVGIPTPVNNVITAALLPLERKSRGLIEF